MHESRTCNNFRPYYQASLYLIKHSFHCDLMEMKVVPPDKLSASESHPSGPINCIVSFLFIVSIILCVCLGILVSLQDTDCNKNEITPEEIKALKNQVETLRMTIKELEQTRKLESGDVKGGVQLVGGDSLSGNILVHGRPVCDDGWDHAAAHVVCRMLGFKEAKEKTTNSRFGLVEENFLMDDVKCSGQEDSLWKCKFDSKNIQCNQFEGAGVVCN